MLGVERLCRYLVHPPIAVERFRYDGAQATYRGRRVHPVSGEDTVTLDPLEMLARLCQHIPPPGFHLTRLYGAYANRTRGARPRRCAAAAEDTPASRGSDMAPSTTPSQRERRRLGDQLALSFVRAPERQTAQRNPVIRLHETWGRPGSPVKPGRFRPLPTGQKQSGLMLV
jgi:hypothetical protein